MRFLTTFIFSFSAIFFIFQSNKKNVYFDDSKSHHTEFGFTNPHLKINDQNKSPLDLLRMMKTDRPNPVNQNINFVNIDDLKQRINNGENFVTWIGHSTFFLHINGKKILTDPIFSDRCSPIQVVGPKRYTKPSIDINLLPRIDMVLISHNHYDHLDRNTIKYLKTDTSTTWFVPLGLAKWLRNEKVKRIIELDWYDEYSLQNVEVVCLPSQHWSKRNLFKSFDTLWASWCVNIENFKFWFAGDTGYNKIQFKDIGESFGPFDLAAIPIGAYEPRWFMKNFHINPKESILIHKDVKSLKSIGMHFGTFVLTTEPIDAPQEEIIKLIEEDSNLIDQFIIPEHGAIYDL